MRFGTSRSRTTWTGIAICASFHTSWVAAQDSDWDIAAPLPHAVAAPATGVIAGKFLVVTGGPVGGFGTHVTQEYDPATNTWQTLANIPTNRLYAASATVGSKLYVMGGCVAGNCSSTGNTNVVESFDRDTNTWSSKPGMPTAAAQSGCDASGSKIYVAGGMGSCTPCVSLNLLQVLDSSTNSWSLGPNLPTGRAGCSATFVNGKLHVVGGSNASGYSTVHEVFDPQTNKWSGAAPLPHPLGNHGAAELHGTLYVFGGETAPSTTSSSVLAFDPITNSWKSCDALSPSPHSYVRPQRVGDTIHVAGAGPGNTPVSNHEIFRAPWSIAPPLPLAVAAPATGVIGDRLYIVSGGPSGGFGTTAVQVYDDSSESFQNAASLSVDRLYAASAVVGDRLYIMGGCIAGNCSASGNTNLVEVFDESANGWSFGPSMPVAASQSASGAIGNKIYVAGGMGSCVPCVSLGNLQILDANGGWSQGPAMPTPRAGAGGAVLGSRFHVVGGSNSGGYSSAHEVFDTVAGSWSSAAPLPKPIGNLGLVALHGKLFAIGGEIAPSTATREVFRYDPITDAWSACVTACPTAHSYLRPQVVGDAIHVVGAGPNNTAISAHEVYRIACGGHALAYGSGCSGSFGYVPTLAFGGCIEPGGVVHLAVAQALGGASGLGFFGLAPAMIPMSGGCNLLVSPLLATTLVLPLSGVGPGAGQNQIVTVLPPATPTPFTFTMQFFVPDPGVARGYSATNGVEVDVEP